MWHRGACGVRKRFSAILGWSFCPVKEAKSSVGDESGQSEASLLDPGLLKRPLLRRGFRDVAV